MRQCICQNMIHMQNTHLEHAMTLNWGHDQDLESPRDKCDGKKSIPVQGAPRHVNGVCDTNGDGFSFSIPPTVANLESDSKMKRMETSEEKISVVKRVNLRTRTEPSSATTTRLMSNIQRAIHTRIGRNSSLFDLANCDMDTAWHQIDKTAVNIVIECLNFNRASLPLKLVR